MSDAELSAADTLPGGARTGEVLAGKYRLERLLGRGGMGEVYEARHVLVGRRFAVKFLHAGSATLGVAAARFLREAQAMGALESPHLAAVLDFDRAADGAPFLVMEFLQGESLARTLSREQRLAVPRVIELLLQACSGLGVAHRAGIVHRDLKPDNLFLIAREDGSELLKVVDFGIAKLLDAAAGGDVTQSGAVLGTPFYMAPEQARGERSVDQRVDVHALGVIAYELLSGKKPHPGDSYNAILAHILTEPVEPLGRLCPSLPKALVAVVERAMAFDPAARYGSVDALASDLSRFAGRATALRGDAVDLVAPRASDGAVTRADTSAELDAPGTLQSAVGDVSAERSGPRGRPAAWVAVALVLAGAFASAMLVRSSPPPAASGAASAQPAPRGASQTASSAPAAAVRPKAAPVVQPPAPSAFASSPPPAAAKPLKRASAPAPSRDALIPLVGSSQPPAPPPITFQPPASPSVTFDEKNPY